VRAATCSLTELPKCLQQMTTDWGIITKPRTAYLDNIIEYYNGYIQHFLQPGISFVLALQASSELE